MLRDTKWESKLLYFAISTFSFLDRTAQNESVRVLYKQKLNEALNKYEKWRDKNISTVPEIPQINNDIFQKDSMMSAGQWKAMRL